MTASRCMCLNTLKILRSEKYFTRLCASVVIFRKRDKKSLICSSEGAKQALISSCQRQTLKTVNLWPFKPNIRWAKKGQSPTQPTSICIVTSSWSSLATSLVWYTLD